MAVLGAPGSGRTALLQRLAFGQFFQSVPSDDKQEVSPVLEVIRFHYIALIQLSLKL